MRRGRVVACGMLVVLLAGCGVGSASESSAPKPAASITDPDVEIFMSVAASEAQIADVQRALRRSDRVRRYKLVTRHDAYREFKRLFKGQPDLVATTSPEALPASVRVTLVPGAALARFATSFGRLPGVDEVKYIDPASDLGKLTRSLCRKVTRSARRVDAHVVLVPDVNRSQRDLIRDRLEQSKSVRSFSYVSEADVRREVTHLFADASLDGGAAVGVHIPTSFRVELSSDGTRRGLARDVGHLAGVASVDADGQLELFCRGSR